MDNNSENKENCVSVNNAPAHNTVEHEIKHRNVHVADWSHEIGDQHVIDSHSIPYKSTSALPHHGKMTFTRKSTNNQQKRNRSQNQNHRPDLQKPNTQKYGPQGLQQPSSKASNNRRSYNPALNRQSSEHSQARNHQPSAYQPNAQTSRSATTSRTFTLMTRNPESNIQVTIPTVVSNDVRFDTRFNKNAKPFIPRQVYSGHVDNAKPTFQQKDGKNKPKNDPPKVTEKPATPSTSQVSTKQNQKPYHQKGPKGKMSPKPCGVNPKAKMPLKPSDVDAKEKIMATPSTSEMKPIQKVPDPPKPVVKKFNPFGDAKPVDVSKKMIEIEQKKLEEQKKLNDLKKEEDKKAQEKKKSEAKKAEAEKLKDKKKAEEEKNDDNESKEDLVSEEDLSDILLNSISVRSRRNSL